MGPVKKKNSKEETGKKAVVLHSGGLDSTTCLLMAIEQGRSVISLGIDYGQKHRVELEYARLQCLRRGTPRKVLKVEWDKASRSIPTNRRVDEIRSGLSTAFLAGRNVVFLSLACAEAAGIGASEVWIGVNAIDFSGYPDCTPDFIDSFSVMIEKAIPSAPKIVAPLLKFSKPDIASEANRLGIGRNDTWSCYSPTISGSGVEPCGRCDACVLHKYAWDEALRRMPSTQTG